MTEGGAPASPKANSNAAIDSQSAPKATSRSSRRKKHEKEKKERRKGDVKLAAENAKSKGKQTTAVGDDAPTVNGKTGQKKVGKKKKRKKSGKKDQDEREVDGDEDGVQGERVKLKVVIRRLPPHLPEAVFWKAISPWVQRVEKIDGKVEDNAIETQIDGSQTKAALVEDGYFVAGKLKEGMRRSGQAGRSDASLHTHSRAYLRFRTPQALVDFHRGFNGHVFRDAKGGESVAVVEFAPFQRMPSDGGRKKVRIDALQGTIGEDAEYKSFLASTEDRPADEDKSHTTAEKTDAQLMAHLSSLAEATHAQRAAKSTPLLDHLRQQRTAKAEAAALKQARSHLHKTHGAYAASSSAKTDLSRGGKSKKNAKGEAAQFLAGQAQDSNIPTGPKAMRKEGMAAASSPSSSKKKEKKEKEREKREKEAKGGERPAGKTKEGKGRSEKSTDPARRINPLSSSKAILERKEGQVDVPLLDAQGPSSSSGHLPATGESTKGRAARRPHRPRTSDTGTNDGAKRKT